MSTSSPRRIRTQAPEPAGLPTWSGIAIVLAALITGLLLSLNAQAMGWPYLACFAVAGLVVAAFTEVRGLFLTVASLPLLFGIMTIVTAWVVGRSLAPDGTAAFSTTTIVTAIYPLTQFFPVLFGTTLAATVIAVARIWWSKRNEKVNDTRAIDRRRRTAEADRRNRATASRARTQTNKVTVEELVARNRQRSQRTAEGRYARPERTARPPRQEPPREVRRPQPEEPPRRRHRRFDDDLYS
ncbi:hypothetical protein CATRI_04265 [Corynebacterium atrinae]|uniref:DUF6542 domain-containing protein n=1 Tax=Corynebacterium atrinae TaxID=1336740 RepID=UPI0025B53C5C|nr:DUF6542 domain-containing protein [Corynebacterium atrinae]WJY62949.1 hypothetical protein CATRI_04265 [Corynebacterium atrinae]